MNAHILLVEDEKLLRRSVKFNLEQANYTVTTASNAEDALELIKRNSFDLILMDIGLPGIDGLDALRQIKAGDGRMPVIFLTARRRELDEALGLELGADDYVTKPFDMPVLLARIKAVLRRVGQSGGQGEQLEEVEAGDLWIDPLGVNATLGGRPLELSQREFDLLYLLASRPEQVVSMDAIINQVWGAEFEGQPQVVYVHIRWLREKIEADPNKPERILTVRKKGYKYIPAESP